MDNNWPGKMLLLFCIFPLFWGCTPNLGQTEMPRVTEPFSAVSATAPAEITAPSLSLETKEPKSVSLNFNPLLPAPKDIVDFDLNDITALLMDRDGFLWAGEHEGLMRWEIATRSPTAWNSNQGLGGIHDMVQVEDGSLWFATDHGVLHFDGYQWTTYTMKNGLPDNSVYRIAVTPDGALWFTNETGITRLYNETWTVYTETNTGQSLSGLWLLSVAPDGTLYSAGMSPLLAFFQNGQWEEAAQVPGDSGYIGDLAVTNDGFIWIGGSKILYQFTGTHWVGFNPWRTKSIGSVNALAVGPEGDLYVGLWVDCVLHRCDILNRDQRQMPGIYRYDGFHWYILNNEAGIANSEVCTMAVSQDSFLWVGTCQDGVLQFDGKSWQQFQ